MISSVSQNPCSMESTPARTAFRMPSAPSAWIITLRPALCASSHGSADFFFGHLCRAGIRALGDYASSPNELDHRCTGPQFLTDGFAELVGAIRLVAGDMMPVPARDAGIQAGGLHEGASYLAPVDHALDSQVDAIRRAGLPAPW